MDIILHSTYLVAIAEMGDKTQLLALMLASRFHNTMQIILAILVATLLNHAIAAYVGVNIAAVVAMEHLKYITAALFVIVGVWALIPDEKPEAPKQHGGVFMTSAIAFFLAEIGDKTQLATVSLGAAAGGVVLVTIGTTLGMMLANVPVVLMGKKMLKKIPMEAVHKIAALSFIAFGVWQLV